MLVTVKYFGMLVETTGTNQESISLHKTSCSLAKLETNILQKYPTLKNTTYNIAVNQKIAERNTILNHGDELAFLPPFAGG